MSTRSSSCLMSLLSSLPGFSCGSRLRRPPRAIPPEGGGGEVAGRARATCRGQGTGVSSGLRMSTEIGSAADIKDSILDAIGETPLVRLSRFGAELKPQLVAKVEAMNPGGSIKDRVGVALIEAAER